MCVRAPRAVCPFVQRREAWLQKRSVRALRARMRVCWGAGELVSWLGGRGSDGRAGLVRIHFDATGAGVAIRFIVVPVSPWLVE